MAFRKGYVLPDVGRYALQRAGGRERNPVCQAFRLLQKTFQHTATGTEPVRSFLSGKLEKLNWELEKSEKKLRKAINDEKALQHQLKQLTATSTEPVRPFL